MSRRMALIVSSALIAFVLVMGMALAIRVGGAKAEAQAAERTAAADVPTTPVTQTEQLYRQRLEEANVGLQRAYDRIASLEAENAAWRQSPQAAEAARLAGPVAAEGAGAVRISAEQAAQIAVRAVGGGKPRSVELESEHGRSVYEVKVGRAEVKVDATTGEAFAEEDD